MFIIGILLLIIIFFSVMIPYTYFMNHSQLNETATASVENSTIADTDMGSVEVIRNVGNPNSSKKIAYVVGVHPLEHEVHETLVKTLPNLTGLNYCYDIYIINVTEDVGNYGDGLSDLESPGRQHGQDLAFQYVYPEIKNGTYDLAVDIHSNVGAYEHKTFVFSPVKEGVSAEYAMEVANSCPNITYYPLDSTTSGPYLTVPLNNMGIPAFFFEEYSFAPQDVKDEHILELIHAVDDLNL